MIWAIWDDPFGGWELRGACRIHGELWKSKVPLPPGEPWDFNDASQAGELAWRQKLLLETLRVDYARRAGTPGRLVEVARGAYRWEPDP